MADRNKPNRRSIRLPEYDYRQPGAYFVTLCAQNRACIFGEIVDAKVRLSLAGQIVQRVWSGLPEFFERVQLDVFIVMPNHFHAILWIAGTDGGRTIYNLSEGVAGAPDDWHGTESGSLGAIVQNFKSISTRKIHALPKMQIDDVWQRNYWERVIRNERELQAIRKYIIENPMQWQMDSLNDDHAVGA